MHILLPLVITLLAVPATAVIGSLQPRWASKTAIISGFLALAALVWSWAMGGGAVSLDWVASWNLRLAFTLDGLAMVYGLLAVGIGLLVMIYSSSYLPAHLEHEHRPPADGIRFYALLLLFMAAMLGLVMSQDLLLIFFFWDITAITSYFLIGYDSHKSQSHQAALMALVITGVSAILFLAGAIALASLFGTYSLPLLIQAAQPGPVFTWSLIMILIAALAKSAQVPLHFWLPRAMAAPTPVSAYLHSAAMVAAGVFLIQRFYPLIRVSPELFDILLIVGLLSMLVGGLLALAALTLKQLLAYSTIAQYGYVVFMIGLGTPLGLTASVFYVLVHGLIKSGLFLTAGAVTQSTNEDRLEQLGGLARRLPWLAAGSGILAAALAGLPLTLGFFKDELFFLASLERGSLFAIIAVFSAALTFAYMLRFWSAIFLGKPGKEDHGVPVIQTGVVGLLAAIVIFGGIIPQSFASLSQAGAASVGEAAPIQLAYHLELNAPNAMALSVYTLALLIAFSRSIWDRLVLRISGLGKLLGPERIYSAGFQWLRRLANRLYGYELRDLARRISSILLPAAVLVGAGLIVTPTENAFRITPVHPGEDVVLILVLLLLVITTVVAAVVRNHLTQVLAISVISYGLIAVFALLGAPDVALVAALIASISTLVFVGIFALFPKSVLVEQERKPIRRPTRVRQTTISIISGIFAFIMAWSALSVTPAREGVMETYMRLTQAAHGQDVVTVILADFRGLDTAGEITVVMIALIGVATLLRKGVMR